MSKKNSPFIFIVLSFIIVIILGSALLKLPFAVTQGNHLSWVNSLFISTSAVCVTGLSPIVLSEVLSPFGKAIVILLVQIGGLGIITSAILVVLVIGGKVNIAGRILIKESLNQDSNQGLILLIKKIVLATLAFEIIGTLVFTAIFSKEYPFFKALSLGLFHSISSFNNAGFDIFGSDSLLSFNNNPLFLITTSLLIVFGGLGFIVIFDIIFRKRKQKLSIHSKIVLRITLFLITVGTLSFYLLEDMNLINAYFLSVSSRTAGFASVDIGVFKPVSLFVLIILMFIGASPVSTGGGIKTTTFYILIITLISYAQGKEPVINYRKVSKKTIYNAFILFIGAITFIVFGLLLILLIENSENFVTILFEVVSAFGTVGLSMGITPLLSSLSKVIIMILMLFGRLGPLTILSVFNRDRINKIDYPEEHFIIG